MIEIIQGDCLEVLRTLPHESVHCCVTSPPYLGLRDYGVDGQFGLEKTPEEYVAKMVAVFREVRRVLRIDGVAFVNMGDSYSSGGRDSHGTRIGYKQSTNRGTMEATGSRLPMPENCKPKDLVGVPWMLAFALRADGWWLRQDIIWHKPNPMPESVTDRCTKAHEYIFLLTKSARYFYDAEAVKEPQAAETEARYSYDFAGEKRSAIREQGIRIRGTPESFQYNPTGRNKRSVWTVPSAPYSEAHFATFPPDLIKPCILAGTSARGCCPKCGAPWERTVEKIAGTPASYNGSDFRNGKKATAANALSAVGQQERTAALTTTGWQAGCSCDGFRDISVPCTVLDPFAGSGTTGMVALELGRNAILIELNPKYVELIQNRTHVTPGLKLA